jgi:uncharacterized protein YegP (UPF0339 family)
MIMGKFVIRETATGFKFDLKASNGEVIATSEVYSTQAAAVKGAQSVAKCAADAKVHDLTVEGQEVTHPKFELYEDKGGEFRFRLKARNGEIIAVSEGYTTKRSCENGIESVRKNAPEAPIEE